MGERAIWEDRDGYHEYFYTKGRPYWVRVIFTDKDHIDSQLMEYVPNLRDEAHLAATAVLPEFVEIFRTAAFQKWLDGKFVFELRWDVAGGRMKKVDASEAYLLQATHRPERLPSSHNLFVYTPGEKYWIGVYCNLSNPDKSEGRPIDGLPTRWDFERLSQEAAFEGIQTWLDGKCLHEWQYRRQEYRFVMIPSDMARFFPGTHRPCE